VPYAGISELKSQYRTGQVLWKKAVEREIKAFPDQSASQFQHLNISKINMKRTESSPEMQRSSRSRRHGSENRRSRSKSSQRLLPELDGTADVEQHRSSGSSRSTPRSSRTLGSGSTHGQKSKSRNLSIEDELADNNSSRGSDKRSNHSRSSSRKTSDRKSGHSSSRRLLDDDPKKPSRRSSPKSLDQRSSHSRNMKKLANEISESIEILDLEWKLGGKSTDSPQLGMESRGMRTMSTGSIESMEFLDFEDKIVELSMDDRKSSHSNRSDRNSNHSNRSVTFERPKRRSSRNSMRRRGSGSTRSKSNTNHSTRSNRSTQDQRKDTDEAFLLYTRVEKSAVQIQQAFRRRHPELVPYKEDKNDHSSDSGDTFHSQSSPPLTTDEEEKKPNYADILVGMAGSFIYFLYNCFPTGGNKDDVKVVANIAEGTNGGGGGGGTGGAEQGPAQAMAGQAASAAGSAASSGVAAAGAAGAAAGAAAAGGLAATVAAGLGVSAAVATFAGVAIAATGGSTTVVASQMAVVSACGLVDPSIRTARVSFWMEGFTNEFDLREADLLGSLLVESYNNITVGDGCSDKYLRELNYAKLINQKIYPANEVNNSIVETTFDTTLFCDGCPEFNSMFGDLDDLGGVSRRNLREAELKRHLAVSMDESFDFFHKFIKEVMLGVKQLSEDEEIRNGFIQLARGYITENDDENENGSSSGGNGGSGEGSGGSGPSMETDINASFNKAGEISAITFKYTVNGEEIISTLSVAPPTEAPTVTPTTEAPTVTPTIRPTVTPTIRPTDAPSYLPTLSQRPSMVNATFAPTDVASSVPSEFPSANPSSQPSTQPSSLPSSMPSSVPSSAPSEVPSEVPSYVPSNVPSIMPSEVPSDSPSSNPSSQPSSKPSSRPSSVPTDMPSRTPSFVPTLSIQPSDVPSKIPSSSPSRNPSSSPSNIPTLLPTISNRPTPCIWTAAENLQSKIGNGPDANCIGIDYLKNRVPVYIIDQSQDGTDVTFRVHPNLFKSNISSLAAIQFDTSTSAAVCDVQSTVSFNHQRQFTGACTNGFLDVTFFLYMCGSEANVNQTISNFCDTPSAMDDYYEYRYKLACWERCETEGPTSGPTNGPTVSAMPTNVPSVPPSVSHAPSNTPSMSARPSASPSQSNAPTT